MKHFIRRDSRFLELLLATKALDLLLSVKKLALRLCHQTLACALPRLRVKIRVAVSHHVLSEKLARFSTVGLSKGPLRINRLIFKPSLEP